MRNPLILWAVLVAAPAVQAAEFTPPAGCESFLTVQSSGCEVQIYYRCSAEPDGHQWRVSFGINGKTFESQIDRETRWLKSWSYTRGLGKVLNDDEPDPASFSTLLATGYDAMEFSQTDSQGLIHHYKGHDKLTGESVVIDGVPLQRTEFDLIETEGDGTFVRHVTGHEFISAEFGRFFGGTAFSEEADGESFPSDDTPITFIRPGEPGFGSTIPMYHCRDMMSALEPFARTPDDQG